MWPFKHKRHQADAYFKAKFRERLTPEAHKLTYEAYARRHRYPDLSGPELVRLFYWGVSGKPNG